MKVVCTQENLRSGLSVVGRIIQTSSTLPILNNILLKTENGMLKLSATNLDIGITTLVRGKVETEGEVCVPAKPLIDVVATLPSVPITLSVEGSEILLTAKSYKTKLKTLAPTEFPVIPEVEDGWRLKIGSRELKTALDEVVFAASVSETQPEISGMFFLAKDKNLKFVCTDRYRLAEKTLNWVGGEVLEGVIVPHRTVIELSRVIGMNDVEVEVLVTQNQFSVQMDGTVIVSRLIDGQYPDYEQIIPTVFETNVSMNRSELVSALKTSGVFSGGVQSVRIEVKTEDRLVSVSSGSQDLGESEVEIEAEITGVSVGITFNFKYLTDCLNVLGAKDVIFKIIGEESPVIIEPVGEVGYRYLVMPIKG